MINKLAIGDLVCIKGEESSLGIITEIKISKNYRSEVGHWMSRDNPLTVYKVWWNDIVRHTMEVGDSLAKVKNVQNMHLTKV